jgi:hypothetical protein
MHHRQNTDSQFKFWTQYYHIKIITKSQERLKQLVTARYIKRLTAETLITRHFMAERPKKAGLELICTSDLKKDVTGQTQTGRDHPTKRHKWRGYQPAGS